MQNNSLIKFIGLNAGRGRSCGENLKQVMIASNTQIALIQEPLVYTLSDGQKRLAGEGGGIFAIYKADNMTGCCRAAIFYKGRPDKAFKLIDELSTSDQTTALWRIDGSPVILVSCYLHAKQNLEESLKKLDKVFRYANGKNVIIHGDFNARSEILTKDRKTNGRGTQLEEWISHKRLIVHNTKKVPTFLTITLENKIKAV